MAYDAFTGGVEPGGLRSKDEIRILLCYLLASVPAPLSRDDILTIMQENGFANYFEVTDSLSELEENGNVLRTPGQPPLLHGRRAGAHDSPPAAHGSAAFRAGKGGGCSAQPSGPRQKQAGKTRWKWRRLRKASS